MPVSLVRRKCETCRQEFVLTRRGKRHCSRTCRYRAANHRKGESRRRILRAAGDCCAIPGCKYDGGGRLFVHNEGGVPVVLCEACNVERVRPDRTGAIRPVVGRYYGGYLHISLDDPDNDIENECTDDGGIGQLVDSLSGELDEDGEPVPHPLDEYGYDRNRRERIQF